MPAGEGVDSRVVQRLAELVGQGCTTCQDAMRTEGVKVLRLMSSNVSDFSRIKCIRKKSKMSDILQVIPVPEPPDTPAHCTPCHNEVLSVSRIERLTVHLCLLSVVFSYTP